MIAHINSVMHKVNRPKPLIADILISAILLVPALVLPETASAQNAAAGYDRYNRDYSYGELAENPSITITSPNGGETWNTGTTCSITWTYNAAFTDTSVKIYYIKGGASPVLIRTVSKGKAGSGSFKWTLPRTLYSGSDYSIRITGSRTTSVLDDSNARFTINGLPAPAYTLTSPNGGESWDAGTTHNITWTYTAGVTDTSVKIYYIKGSASPVLIRTVSRGKAGSGSFKWAIPRTMPGGSDYSIRITGSRTTSVLDDSNARFTINGLPAPGYTITSPNGGESWDAGTTHNITWTYTAGVTDTSVKIYYIKGSASPVLIRTVSRGTAGSGSFKWAIPRTLAGGSDYSIRITGSRTTSVLDDSNARFTVNGIVKLPDLTIVFSPASSYAAGQTGVSIPVTVNRSGGNLTRGTYVDAALYWSTNGTYDSGDTRLWHSDGSIPDYPITNLNTNGYKAADAGISIPNVSTGTYYIIAVVDPDSYHSESSESNNTYRKSVRVTAQADPSSIDIAAPESGDSWEAGTAYQIKWNYHNIDPWHFKIELLKGGVLNAPINNHVSPDNASYNYAYPYTSGSVSYTWTVPSSQAAGSYTVKISTADASTPCSQTSATFTIKAADPLPDLTVSTSHDSSYVSGQIDVPVSVTVTRSGGNLTRGTYVDAALYWSTNGAYDTGDTQLWHSNGSKPDYPISALNANGSVTVTPNITIPGVSSGTYYIIAMVDPASYHTEASENNNTHVSSVYISPPQPIAWEFNQAGNFEGWWYENMSSAAVNGGQFSFDPKGGDPYIYSATISASATSYTNIEMSMASNAPDGSGAIFFRTQAENYYSEDKKVQFAVYNCSLCTNAAYNHYNVYMNGHPKWSGVITGIRIDPAENGQAGTDKDTIGIDYIILAP